MNSAKFSNIFELYKSHQHLHTF